MSDQDQKDTTPTPERLQQLTAALVSAEGADVIAHVLALGFLAQCEILRKVHVDLTPGLYEQELDRYVEAMNDPGDPGELPNPETEEGDPDASR